MAEFDIGITTFFLNEAKFLRYSVESVVKSPAVKSVVLVEGCVKNQPRTRVSKKGFSTDGSSEIAASLAEEYQKVEYVPAGFVDSKKDLQNRGFHIIRARLGDGAIYMLVAADELYYPDELVALQNQFVENPRAKIILYPFFHFWWRPDLIAIGSSWDVPMHRAYRRPGLPMQFTHHAAPPADCGNGPKLHAKVLNDYVCRCYHYVGMQDAATIAEKLELYHKRDGGRLKVIDTWSLWQWGEKTQWTHAGGSVRRFTGTHPPAIEPHVWNLTPRSQDGSLLPLPTVPWDSRDHPGSSSPPQDIAIFIEGHRLPSEPLVAALISHLKEHHKLTVYTLDGELQEPSSYQVRKFKAQAFNNHPTVILFPETFVIRPQTAKHVAILWKQLEFELDFSGYQVYRVPTVDGKHPELPPPDEFLQAIFEAPTVSRQPPASRQPAKTVPAPREILGRQPAPASSGEVMQVRLVNISGIDWEVGKHFIGAFWATNKGTQRPDAPRTKANLPVQSIRRGDTLICSVQIPRPPADMENGFLQLCIDILDQPAGKWLNVGTRTPVQIKQWRVYI